MAYGWQIFNEQGALMADHTVIMSRRLGVYYIPFINYPGGNMASWVQNIGVNFNGGTPFVHCTVGTGVTVPAGRVYATILPDIQIVGNNIRIEYNWKHWTYPDDLGLPLIIGNMNINYGVYNQ